MLRTVWSGHLSDQDWLEKSPDFRRVKLITPIQNRFGPSPVKRLSKAGGSDKMSIELMAMPEGEMSVVEKGFNSDIVYRGMNFHVQSEDWGLQNPYLVSRVYQNGAVIKSVKTSYTEVLRPTAGYLRPGQNSEEIRSALRSQHEKILDLLLSGQLF